MIRRRWADFVVWYHTYTGWAWYIAIVLVIFVLMKLGIIPYEDRCCGDSWSAM